MGLLRGRLHEPLGLAAKEDSVLHRGFPMVCRANRWHTIESHCDSAREREKGERVREVILTRENARVSESARTIQGSLC